MRISLDDIVQGNSRDYESFAAGASFVPLIIVIFFAATTKMVRYIQHAINMYPCLVFYSHVMSTVYIYCKTTTYLG